MVTRLGTVAQELRAVAIHQQLAADEAHPLRFRRCEQRIDGALVDGWKDRCSGRAVTQQLRQKEIRGFPRVLRIGKASLGRKGVALEPGEQLFARTRNDVALRVVDVRVDETRD